MYDDGVRGVIHSIGELLYRKFKHSYIEPELNFHNLFSPHQAERVQLGLTKLRAFPETQDWLRAFLTHFSSIM